MIKDILTSRFNAKHWDRSKKVSSDDIDYITDCIQKSPSKMSVLNYKVVLITDSPSGLAFKNWLFYEHTWNYNGDRAPDGVDSVGKRDYNGQYLAPILIAWLNPLDSPNEGIINNQRMVFPDFNMRQNNIFISNSIAMMAAEEQGLNTGFGSCHDNFEVAKKLGFDGFHCPIMLGLGYAKDMSKEIESMNIFVPVADPKHIGQNLGTCFVNLPAHYSKPVRELRPNKDELVTVI